METEKSGTHLSIRSRTDKKIQDAVLEIIHENGLGAITMESVAAQSGVAKTTLYRRYSNRVELISDVLSVISPLSEGDSLVAGPVTKESLISAIREAQDVYENLIGIAAVGELLYLTADEGLKEWRERIFVPRFSVFRQYCEKGVADGTLSPGVNYKLISEMIVGAMIMRDSLDGDVPDDWAEEIIDAIWPLIVADKQS